MRTACKVWARPDREQTVMLSCSFGRVRVVRNRTLALHRGRYPRERVLTSYREGDAELTAMNRLTMVKNRSSASSISRAGRGESAAMRTHTARRCCVALVTVDCSDPSSNTCSAGGHLGPSLSLRTRRWTCQGCGTRHDRDVSAATDSRTAARLVADACGGDVTTQGCDPALLPVAQAPVGASPQGIPVQQVRE